MKKEKNWRKKYVNTDCVLKLSQRNRLWSAGNATVEWSILKPNQPAFDRASSLVAILVSRNKCIFVEKGEFFIRKNTHVKCVKQWLPPQSVTSFILEVSGLRFSSVSAVIFIIVLSSQHTKLSTVYIDGNAQLSEYLTFFFYLEIKTTDVERNGFFLKECVSVNNLKVREIVFERREMSIRAYHLYKTFHALDRIFIQIC